ncbi:MAG: cytochrome oxidase subunit III [Candidatus Dadabacteria bacterium]|nr:MAG: cytochrome oxidase subunit III [Candidatus Dadabacteria bacterium]
MSAQTHEHSVTGIPNKKLIFWMFLASDCMFFGSLISTYIVYRGRSIVGPYPLDVFDANITTISTFVLLMSSYFMVLTLKGVNDGKIGQFRLWCAMTALGGLTFLGFQAYEFTHFVHEGLTLSRNVFGSSFFVLTGTHGTHVAIGVLWLLSMLTLSFFRKDEFGPQKSIDVEIMGLYWHFVDIVWIILFTIVYLAEYVF